MTQPSHPAEGQFARYRSRALAPLELLEFDDHLAACDPCRLRLYKEVQAAAQLLVLKAELSGHLEYEQLAASAEGSVVPGVAQHLAECAMCRAEVDDLRRFRSELNAAPRAPVQMPARKKLSWPIGAIAAGAILLAAAIAFRYAGPPKPPGIQATLETPLSPEQREAVQAAIANHQLARSPILDRVISKRGVQLGAPSGLAFGLIGPLGTAVTTDRPIFHWKPVAGAAQYVVAIFDENFVEVATSPAVTATRWQLDRPLPRGRIYNWQVTATSGGSTVHAPEPPEPEARLQVASLETVSDIENARRGHPGNHLLLAVLYAKAGALDEASAELVSLAASDPATAAALQESLIRMRQP